MSEYNTEKEEESGADCITELGNEKQELLSGECVLQVMYPGFEQRCELTPFGLGLTDKEIEEKVTQLVKSAL